MAAETGPVVDLSGLCTQIDDTIGYIQREKLTPNDVEAACTVVEKVIGIVEQLAQIVYCGDCNIDELRQSVQAAKTNTTALQQIKQTDFTDNESAFSELYKKYHRDADNKLLDVFNSKVDLYDILIRNFYERVPFLFRGYNTFETTAQVKLIIEYFIDSLKTAVDIYGSTMIQHIPPKNKQKLKDVQTVPTKEYLTTIFTTFLKKDNTDMFYNILNLQKHVTIFYRFKYYNPYKKETFNICLLQAKAANYYYNEICKHIAVVDAEPMFIEP